MPAPSAGARELGDHVDAAACRPSRTIPRPSPTTWRTSAAVRRTRPPRARARCAAPARRAASRRDRDQSASAPARSALRRASPAGVPAAGGCGQHAAARAVSALAASPGARRARWPAPPRSRSITACESVPTASATPASAHRPRRPDAVGEVALGRRARCSMARPPRAARRRRRSQLRGVHGREAAAQRAGRVQQLRRRAAVRSGSRVVLGRLLAHVGVQRAPRSRRPRRPRPAPSSGSTARTECIAAPICSASPSASSADALAPRPASPSLKRRCARPSGSPIPRQVARVEQREAHACLGARPRAAPSPISFGSAYGAPPGRVVHVVELAHRGDARPAPSRRTSPVPGAVPRPGRAAPRARTSAPATSRTTPLSAWVRPAGLGGTCGGARWRGRAA